MTHKDILLEVQKACHIDAHQCSALFEAMSRMMAQAGVEQVPVTIPGLGTFTSHKHPEYIQEDPQTGKQTLFPPRITYRMQTEEEEWTPNLLAKQLAEHLKMEPEVTRSFISALVNTILNALKRGEEAEVRGLGVFRVIATQQGELTRMAYTPDDQMRQLVNAPFNCFEPMPIENHAAPVVSTAAEMADEPVAEKLVVEEPIADEPIAVEPPVEKPVDEEPIIVEKTIEEKSIEMKPEAQPVEEEQNEQPEVIFVEAPSKPEPKTEPTPAKPTQPSKADDDDEDYYLERSRKKDNRILFYTLISLIVIACLAIFKFIYNLDRLDSDRDYVPSKVVVDTAPANDEAADLVADVDTEAGQDVNDATEPSPEAAEPQQPAADVIEPAQPAAPVIEPSKPVAPVVDQSKPVSPTDVVAGRKKNADGTYATHKLQGGETLRLIAEKYYGSREFWSYIYEVNSEKLPNPNVVPAGIVLYLPDATYFGIDAQNPASISKAKSKGSQIINQSK